MEETNERLVLSPAAGFVHSTCNVQNTCSEIAERNDGKIEDMDPVSVLKLMTGLVNVFNYGIAASREASPENHDAYVYLHAALCQHEGLVRVIDGWEPDDYTMAGYLAEEDTKKAVDLINEYRSPFVKMFNSMHDRLHKEKIIVISDYENDLKKFTMKFSNHPEVFKLNITNEDELNFENICKEDVEAIITMAGKFEMPELHDWETAQAAASHVNSLITDDTKSAKDMDEFDLMNACLGYCLIDMNTDGEEKLKEFLKGCIQRDREVSGDKKYEGDGEGSVRILTTQLPTYKISGNKILVFEPSKISKASAEDVNDRFKDQAKMEIIKGISDILSLSSNNLINDDVRSFANGSMLKPENSYKFKDREVMKKIITWLGPWAGHLSKFPDGLSAGGVETLEDLKDKSDLDKWEGSCIFKAMEDYFKEDKTRKLKLTLELVITLGILQFKGPHGLIAMIVKDEFSPMENLKGLSAFKKQVIDNGYNIDTDTIGRSVYITTRQE